MMTMIGPGVVASCRKRGFVVTDRVGDRADVELYGEPTRGASGEFEVIANVHDPDENAQDRSPGYHRSIGWVPGLRAVVAGPHLYLLCLPRRERTIAAPRSALTGRSADTLHLGRVGHVSRQAAHYRADERNDKGAKR